jgi:hypothetical protein
MSGDIVPADRRREAIQVVAAYIHSHSRHCEPPPAFRKLSLIHMSGDIVPADRRREAIHGLAAYL